MGPFHPDYDRVHFKFLVAKTSGTSKSQCREQPLETMAAVNPSCESSSEARAKRPQRFVSPRTGATTSDPGRPTSGRALHN